MKLLSSLFVLALLPPCSFAGAATSGADSEFTTLIRPGVLHRVIFDPRGPWQIHVLVIDLRRNDLYLESGRAGESVRGRERTSSMAARGGEPGADVVAALNGDFFDLETGESVNNQFSQGDPVRALVPPGNRALADVVVRSQFGFSFSGRPVLGRFVFDGMVFWPRGGETPLSAVNVHRARAPLVLFTGYSGTKTKTDTTSGAPIELPLIEVGRRGDTLIALVRGLARKGGGFPLSREACVLASFGGSRFLDSLALRPGDSLRISLGFIPPVPPLRMLIGGVPWLVREGGAFVANKESLEGARESFATTRHPRSGVGFSRDSLTLYFLAVDGRQSASVGMTLEDFSNLMIEQGVYEGLNLDGGGSTTMVIDGAVVNSPSDAEGERPVANCLFLMERQRSNSGKEGN
jgi:hypothetical protein